MRISDWSADVCSSDLHGERIHAQHTRLRQGWNDGGAGAEPRPGGPRALSDLRGDRADAGSRHHHRGDHAPSGAPPADPGVERPDHRYRLPLQPRRSEEPTSELQSLMRTSYPVFCLKKKNQHNTITNTPQAPTLL